MKSKIFVYVFVLLMLFGSSYALSVDFFASTDFSSYSQCSCSSIISKVNIVNTGDFDANFFLDFQGDLKDYTSFSPQFLHLKPKEQGYFMVFVNLPCNWEGKKTLKTIVSSDLNVKKTIAQDFNLERCFTVSLEKFTNQSCSLFSYQVLLKNSDKFNQNFTLTVKGVKNATYPKNVFIPFNDSKLINIDIKSKKSAILEVISDYTKQKVDLDLPVNVKCPNKISHLDWIIAGGAGLILLIILIIFFVIKSNPKTEKRPKIVSLNIERKVEKRKWPAILFAIFFIVLIGVVAYFGYVYVPKLFVGNHNVSSLVVNPVNLTHTFHGIENYWVYVAIGGILLMIMLLILWLSNSERGSFWKFLFKLFLTLLIVGIILCLIWLGWHYWALIWAFLKLYWLFILIGVVLLVLLIVIVNHGYKYEENEEINNDGEDRYICEFCGKEYKTEKGLKNHKKKVHHV